MLPVRKKPASKPQKKKPDFAKRFAVTAEDKKAVRPGKTLRDLLEEDRGE
jgi:hypothetical protein